MGGRRIHNVLSVVVQERTEPYGHLDNGPIKFFRNTLPQISGKIKKIIYISIAETKERRIIFITSYQIKNLLVIKIFFMNLNIIKYCLKQCFIPFKRFRHIRHILSVLAEICY